MDKLSTKLKKLRKAAGYTQKEAADRLGVAPSTIGMYEQGRREPDLITTQKICDLYGVSPAFLVDENSDAPYEITDMIGKMRNQIKQSDGIMFDGVPISETDTEVIFDAMILAAELVMKKRQEEEQNNE